MLGLFLPFCSPLHVLRTWCICRNWFTLLRSHALPCALLSASGLGPSKAVPAFLPGLAQEVSSCVPQSLKLQTTFQSYQSLSHSLSHCQFHCGSHQSLWATTPSWHSGNLRQSFFSRHRNSNAQRSVKRWRNREASCNMRLSMWLSVKFQDVKLRPGASRGHPRPAGAAKALKMCPVRFPGASAALPLRTLDFQSTCCRQMENGQKNYVRKESYVRKLSDVQTNL